MLFFAQINLGFWALMISLCFSFLRLILAFEPPSSWNSFLWFSKSWHFWCRREGISERCAGGARSVCSSSLAWSWCCRRISRPPPVCAAAANGPDLLLAGYDSLLLTLLSVLFHLLYSITHADGSSGWKLLCCFVLHQCSWFTKGGSR